jgi:hypothetical protein
MRAQSTAEHIETIKREKHIEYDVRTTMLNIVADCRDSIELEIVSLLLSHVDQCRRSSMIHTLSDRTDESHSKHLHRSCRQMNSTYIVLISWYHFHVVEVNLLAIIIVAECDSTIRRLNKYNEGIVELKRYELVMEHRQA